MNKKCGRCSRLMALRTEGAGDTLTGPMAATWFCENCDEPLRTCDDAISEANGLLTETFEKLDADNDRDCWFMVRITKLREALADCPLKDPKPEEQVRR